MADARDLCSAKEGSAGRWTGVELLPPDTCLLDRYRVVERIASGGLSVVYRGTDERLPRHVCIKVFHALSKNCDSEDVFRASYDHFVQEAYALSRLDHPNTLRIYDFGFIEAPGRPSRSVPVQISELMNGGTLEQWVVQRGPLPRGEVLKVASCIGGALAEAHSHGIAHLDIKPKNILFSSVASRQIVKLADFGIAKQSLIEPAALGDWPAERVVASGSDSEPSATRSGPCECHDRRLLMYSLNWAAPEQLTGTEVTRAADIYSLGLVVLYMMTGRMLFRAKNRLAALAQRAAADRGLQVIAAEHGVARPLLELLTRCCANDPAARPAGVERFVEELHLAWGVEGTSERRRLHPLLVAIDGAATDVQPRRPQRLRLGTSPKVGDRRVTFTAASDPVDWIVGDGARVRCELLPDLDGRFCLHLKGLNCFVRLDHRPLSSAVQVKRSASLSLVAPDQRLLASGVAQFGDPAAGHSLFHVGTLPVAISARECRWIIGVDFGPPDAFRFVYAPARPAAEPSDSRLAVARWRSPSTSKG